MVTTTMYYLVTKTVDIFYRYLSSNKVHSRALFFFEKRPHHTKLYMRQKFDFEEWFVLTVGSDLIRDLDWVKKL